jgi:hypothetical protein
MLFSLFLQIIKIMKGTPEIDPSLNTPLINQVIQLK